AASDLATAQLRRASWSKATRTFFAPSSRSTLAACRQAPIPGIPTVSVPDSQVLTSLLRQPSVTLIVDLSPANKGTWTGAPGPGPPFLRDDKNRYFDPSQGLSGRDINAT